MKLLSTVPVELGADSYSIQIGEGWIEDLGKTLNSVAPEGRIVIVTNPEIGARWLESVSGSLESADREVETLEIPEGEAVKNLETVSTLYDYLIERNHERSSILLALGGGVVGDVVGFAAATFLRGVRLVQLPTSLLAMVDSSIGGKTGVNHRLGKNLVGAFKQPCFVGIELDFLETLPEEEFRAGMAEVVKYGMISDAGLFDYIEANLGAICARETDSLAHIVTRSCEIKAQVVSKDEFESGLRAILNFGHTFGHAAEALARYTGLRHGEAVAGGMMAACRLGETTAGFDPESTARLGRLLAELGLPTRLPAKPIRDYVAAMRRDKKVKAARLRFVVPTRIGEVEIRDDIEEAAAIGALEKTLENPN